MKYQSHSPQVVFSLICLASFLGMSVMASEPALPKQQLDQLRKDALVHFQPIPEKMPGGEQDTPARVKLGEKLFFDNRLSANNAQSCNSCHAVDNHRGGVDNLPTSPGAFGKKGDRNSPTVLNAGFQFAQFWDGRSPSLEDQAKGPILNPVEMAMASADDVLKKLREVPEYKKLFAAAFPGEKEQITYDNLAAAIASFERTLVTQDRFDDFLKGQDSALTPLELQGLQKFIQSGCTTCHNGSVLGGTSYQKSGLVKAYKNAKDRGRFQVTNDEDDEFRFKVPILRNIAITAPYFHDGQVATLEEAVKLMGEMQLGLEFSDQDVKAVTAFLKSLTDKPREKALTAVKQ
jgi:cytochrome c peroxidase